MNDDDDDKSDRCPTTRTMLYFNMLGFADRGLTAPVYRAQLQSPCKSSELEERKHLIISYC